MHVLDNANGVMNLNAEHIKKSTVKVSWSSPLSPNGQVLAYKVFLLNATQHTIRKVSNSL